MCNKRARPDGKALFFSLQGLGDKRRHAGRAAKWKDSFQFRKNRSPGYHPTFRPARDPGRAERQPAVVGRRQPGFQQIDAELLEEHIRIAEEWQ
jgi:hypothetical protein